MIPCCHLTKAILANDLETVKRLINQGVELNFSYDTTPLALAASLGNLEIVQLLIEGGANINLQMEDEGDTALMVASLYGHYEVVKRLVEAGADVNIQDCYGAKAVGMAANNAHEDIYNYLAPLTIPKYEPGSKLLAEAKRQKNIRNEKGLWIYKLE